jgi:hypothetical protein
MNLDSRCNERETPHLCGLHFACGEASPVANATFPSFRPWRKFTLQWRFRTIGEFRPLRRATAALGGRAKPFEKGLSENDSIGSSCQFDKSKFEIEKRAVEGASPYGFIPCSPCRQIKIRNFFNKRGTFDKRYPLKECLYFFNSSK